MASVFALVWLVASSFWGEWESPRLRALLIFWSVLVGGTLLMRLRNGNCWLVLMLQLLLRRVAAEPDVWTDGSLVDDKVFGSSSAGAGCFTYRCSRLWANWRWGHLDEDVGEVAVLFLVHCSLSRGLSSGVLFLLCRLMMGYILGLTILELYGMLAASWMARLLLVLLSWLRMGILFCFLRGCSVFGVGHGSYF